MRWQAELYLQRERGGQFRAQRIAAVACAADAGQKSATAPACMHGFRSAVPAPMDASAMASASHSDHGLKDRCRPGARASRCVSALGPHLNDCMKRCSRASDRRRCHADPSLLPATACSPRDAAPGGARSLVRSAIEAALQPLSLIWVASRRQAPLERLLLASDDCHIIGPAYNAKKCVHTCSPPAPLSMTQQTRWCVQD